MSALDDTVLGWMQRARSDLQLARVALRAIGGVFGGHGFQAGNQMC